MSEHQLGWFIQPTYKHFGQTLSKTFPKKATVINLTSEASPLLKYLEEKGVTLKDLIDAAL
ncbi:MAG: hypothetical protein OEY83_01880, partial [Candidatus Bathyarchaeota archaeon]|nr:hypothetical protein [Candidatus Bathyarchaeota archaeon]